MSSFVINKIEFVKAAGLMYGIEESKGNDAHRWWLNHIRERFVECYRMNVASVAEQYGDEDTGDTEPDFDAVFEKYRVLGRKIWESNGYGNVPMNRFELRTALMKFFESVLYQIENESMNEKVAALFFSCVDKMTDDVVDEVDGWWGEVEI